MNQQYMGKTLRLLYPQWQGGYDESEFPGQIYPLGARLLAWLAPASEAPLVEVPVEKWAGGNAPKEGGVFYRQEILRQMRAARSIIDAHTPERIITFGGDCLISQAPFAYLNERYGGKMGVLWIDAHPDVTTPDDFDHAHAMVLGNLLGRGEPLMAAEVRLPLKPEQVALVGVNNVLPHEQNTIDRLGLTVMPGRDVMHDSTVVTAWMRERELECVAVHLDLDVLDPSLFRSLLFANPAVEKHIEAERGKNRIQEIGRLLADVAAQAHVVGMSFAEHMPWDALNLQKMLSALPFMR
ncbi:MULTISPECIES: arginase family protein [unclassified Desulfovibrio]|uniref:arginase family protein n=1 Tax=unclassified Desulfovibrio TaxID=2593640 RepID=UPI000F5EF1C3|nr:MULTISPECIES: arginase family protein [unclassified Desulfovibrio]RRD70927.1 arginase family protein [Desulfovibrio sp. OH1209_COT-279]RRD87300.1 arginase family protein [Desulfovibrio sp. OH1186_COT-070]